MKRFARILFAGLGIVSAGSAMSLVPHKAATAGPVSAVTVTNPSLAVTQSGPWNVGITGTPSVNANITNQVPVTGTVNANVSFPSNQQVTLALASLLNMGKLPSQQVVLRSTSSGICPAYGALAGWVDAYTDQCFNGIPNGSVLVITDVDWGADTLFNTPTYAAHSCDVFISGAPPPGITAIFLSSGVSDVDGKIRKSEHLSGGLYINPAAQGSLAPFWTSSVNTCTVHSVILRGYLVPNQ